MFADVSRDVVVGVIVAVSQVEDHWNSNGTASFNQVFGEELLLNVEFISGTLKKSTYVSLF